MGISFIRFLLRETTMASKLVLLALCVVVCAVTVSARPRFLAIPIEDVKFINGMPYLPHPMSHHRIARRLCWMMWNRKLLLTVLTEAVLTETITSITEPTPADTALSDGTQIIPSELITTENINFDSPLIYFANCWTGDQMTIFSRFKYNLLSRK